MKRLVSAAEVMELIRSGLLLRDLQLSEGFDLPLEAEALHFEGCSFRSLGAGWEAYDYPVSFSHCTFEHIFCMAGYFYKGFSLEHCQVEGEADFNCGLHNKPGFPFRLKECRFVGFVNFFDCVFEGEVEIVGNVFAGGTNLLGNKAQPYEASFEVPPVIAGNVGAMDLDGG